ncbi:MAG: RecX family transcriptional regulator [Polyangiaceae bacterium]
MATRKPPSPEQALSAANLEKLALSYLNRFDTSVVNLRKVLSRQLRRHQREASPELLELAAQHIEGLLQRYAQSGVLDDRRYASTIAWSLRERGASSRAIEHKLSVRGVSSDDIREAIHAADRDQVQDAELAAARRFTRRRRLGPHRSAAERKAKRDRDLGALARAGFSLDVARRVLEEEPE